MNDAALRGWLIFEQMLAELRKKRGQRMINTREEVTETVDEYRQEWEIVKVDG